MKTCKVKPNYNTCAMCIDMQILRNDTVLCSECTYSKDYELLKVGATALGSSYAIVCREGIAKKVALRKVIGIKEATQ